MDGFENIGDKKLLECVDRMEEAVKVNNLDIRGMSQDQRASFLCDGLTILTAHYSSVITQLQAAGIEKDPLPIVKSLQNMYKVAASVILYKPTLMSVIRGFFKKDDPDARFIGLLNRHNEVMMAIVKQEIEAMMMTGAESKEVN